MSTVNSSNTKKTRRGLPVFVFMLSIYLIFLLLQTLIPSLRYAKYLLPIIAAVDFITFRNSQELPTYHLRQYFQHYLWLYFFLIFCSFTACFFRGFFQEDIFYLRFFQEAYFIFSPIVFISIIYFFYDPNRKEQYAKYVFWGLIFAFVIEKAASIASIIANPGGLITALNSSTVSTESSNAFALGLFSLYFLFSGNVIYFLISSCFMILSFKRIVLLGFIISFTVYAILKSTKFTIHKYKNFIAVIPIILNFVMINIAIQMALGYYDELILDYTGLSANAFLMGRQHLYNQVLERIGDISWLGAGLGKTAAILRNISLDKGLLNLHSDILKNYLEFGPYLFCLWIFLTYRFNAKATEMFALVVYLNILFLTDNVFTYFDVMFIFYLLAGFLLPSNNFRNLAKRKPY